MATSYANAGGTGNRTSIITVTYNPVGIGGAGGTALINGNTADSSSWFNSLTFLQFEFSGFKKIIDEAKFYQSNTTSHGVWKWQGSNDGSAWTDIGGTFTLGGVATQTFTTLAGNTTEYKFYRILKVSGATSTSPYTYEFEFKIENGTAIVTEPRVSQLVVETVTVPSPVIRNTQLVVETASFAGPALGLRTTQVVVEVAALDITSTEKVQFYIM
jgi:hypothetical protein